MTRKAVASLARCFFFFVLLALLLPTEAQAQGDYGVRVPSRDGQWLLPVASRLLGSTDADHIHRGSINSWDVSASVGTPVYAAAAGVVKTSGCYLYERKVTSNLQGYGCSVQIAHGNGIVTQYAHCQENSLQVQAGQQVTQASYLCRVGETGVTSWPHVHFTILKNGSPIPVGSVFDIGQMNYCKFCRAKNQPDAPITTGRTGIMGQARSATFDRNLAFMVLTVLLLTFWLVTKDYIRYVLYFFLAIYAAVLTGISYAPTERSAASMTTWDTAYSFVRQAEGAKCVHDPGRTYKGITQGTYNRWLKMQGDDPADVCTSLTERQAEAIYFDLYWLASGANQLPDRVAITVFDWAVNAGVGEAKKVLAICGADARCINNYREQFYRSSGSFHLYGAGWLNRLNRIRSITER